MAAAVCFSLVSCCYLLLLISLGASLSLFPYGNETGDSLFSPSIDQSIQFNFSSGFTFYNMTYKTYHVSSNGVISFTRAIPHYNPLPLTADSLIAPFWSDVAVDTGHIWYRTSRELSTILRVRSYVFQYFPQQDGGGEFLPHEVLIVTWDQIRYSTDKNNTFQCVLATDGFTSYAMFLFPENGINWYSANNDSAVNNTGEGAVNITGEGAAQVGFSKGDGVTFHAVNISMTPDVIHIDGYSNVDQPGLYMWQINEYIISGRACRHGDASIFISPNRGNELGGTPVSIRGPCFHTTDNIECIFESTTVPAVRVSTNEAMCISPMIDTTGVNQIDFTLQVNGNTSNSVPFYLQPFVDLADVHVVNNSGDPLFLIQADDPVNLQWLDNSIFPLAGDVDIANVDVQLYWLNIDLVNHRVEGSTLTYYSESLTNVVHASFTIPGSISDSKKFVPIIFKVIANVSSIASDNPYIQALQSLNTHQSGATPAGKWSHVIVWRANDVSDYCTNDWSFDSWELNTKASVSTPACPCNIGQAELSNSGFEANILPGRRLIDDFLHDKLCYLSTERAEFHSPLAGEYQARQKCCYDKSNLIVGAPSGGYELRNVPKNEPTVLSFAKEFTDNIAPHIGCCITSTDHCETQFYTRRSSDNCQDFTPTETSFMYGDPHLQTLDGLQYTFNGRGEFILVQTIDDSFTIQGRMIPLTSSDGILSTGTVFSAIVAKQNDSDCVEFQYNFITGLRVLVNGDWVLLESDSTGAQYTNVNIRNRGNDIYGAVFSSGVSIEVKQDNGFLALVSISVPDSFMSITNGLLGHFNGNLNNELVSRAGNVLPRSPSTETIHYQFGLSWLLNDSSESLFTYASHLHFSSYYDPNFTPVFQPSFTDPDLEQQANGVCQNNTACLFDISATGLVRIGMSTIEQVQTIETLTLLSQSIVCDPACVNGACVSTGTCSCPYGYEGDLCEDIINFSCGQSSPCSNNGSCSIQVFTYVCNCTSPFAGDFCETVDCGSPPEAISPLLVTFSNTSVGSIAVYSCIGGHVVTGDTESMCQENGMWSDLNTNCIVDCGELSTHSVELMVEYSSTLLDSVARYSCPENFTLVGVRNRTCTASGEWSDQTPYCQLVQIPLVDCGQPPVMAVSHLTVTSNGTVPGSVAIYSCQSGYVLFGTKHRTCSENGAWTDILYQRCIRDCGVPTVVTSDQCLGYVFYNSTIEGSIFKYYCSSTGECLGVAEGNAVSTCLSNGTWSGPPPKCLVTTTLIDCGEPPVWNSGLSALYNATTLGSIVTYYCSDPSLELANGNTTAVCLETGEWQAEQPICIEPAIDSTVYIVVGSTLAGVLIVIIVILLVVLLVGISLTRFKATFEVEKENIQLSEI